MNKKKLPIIIPPIIGLHYHAYPLSVVLSKEKYWSWFLSNYIQVYGIRDFSEVFGSPWFNFASIDIWYNGIPCISNCHLLDQKSVISNKINVVEIIKNYIDRGWYTYAEVDDYFIPFRANYQKCRTPHDIFIFGYDLNDNCFDTSGFNSSQEFSFNKLSFADFEKAYYSNETSMCDVDLGGNNFVRFFTVIEDLDCIFDLQFVTESIGNYLNSIDIMKDIRISCSSLKKKAFGMETYSLFKEYYQLLIDNKIEYDIRPIHLFWEHKNCMLLRIEYMYKNNIVEGLKPIFDDYKNVENKAIVVRNHMIRYELTNDKNELEKIINFLDYIKNKEQELLTSLWEKMRGSGAKKNI